MNKISAVATEKVTLLYFCKIHLPNAQRACRHSFPPPLLPLPVSTHLSLVCLRLLPSAFTFSFCLCLPLPFLSIGLPSGSLQEPTLALFAKAGFQVSGASRSYKPATDDPELQVRLLRAQEISRYVEHGFLDAGLTGRDWIEENGSDIAVLCDLPFSKASAAPTRWVLAVPNASPIQTRAGSAGQAHRHRSRGLDPPFPRAPGRHGGGGIQLGRHGGQGARPGRRHRGHHRDGQSLRANNLRIVATLMESYPQLIANHAALRDPWKAGQALADDDPAPGRAGRARQGGAQDEHRGKGVAKAPDRPTLPSQTDRFLPSLIRAGWPSRR